eukprot:scaffold177270_cov30-Tisochrysis_lutea.AAC.5
MYLKCIWPEAKYIFIWLYLQAPAPYFPSRVGGRWSVGLISHLGLDARRAPLLAPSRLEGRSTSAPKTDQ